MDLLGATLTSAALYLALFWRHKWSRLKWRGLIACYVTTALFRLIFY